MNRSRKRRFSLLLLLTLLAMLPAILAACSMLNPQEDGTQTPPTETSDADPGTVTGEANVESIEILLLESFPIQVNVIASGVLPDGCTSLTDPTPRREGNTFVVNLATSRVEEEVCTQATVPFDKVIPLEVEGLSAGTYTVAVNGLTDTFTLEADNVAGEEEPEATPETSETPEAPPAGAETGSISGRVWHDLCAVAGGEAGAPAVPSEGCVALEDGIYQANGVREEEEPGIEGVAVMLGEGACPADGLADATTGGNGIYTIDNLEPGTYCVTVDALAEGNETILVPGDWTAPETGDTSGVATATVEVSAGTLSEDIDFGWDYQFLPEPEGEDGEPTTEQDCTDLAEFVADVTVLDNEIMPPTFEFTKTWRLENSGSCTWTTGYSLVFVSGDQLGAPDQVPLPTEVQPESTVDLTLQMTAPDVDGTYRSEWMLENEQGTQFGIPGPFWTQIQVTAAIPENAAHITGLVWSDLCSPPGAEAQDTPQGCVALADGVVIADGIYDVGEPRVQGVTVSLAEGACPATTAVATSTTTADGRYRFTGLDAGTYCVFVDPGSSNNAGVLMPGAWSWPEDLQGTQDIAAYTIELEPLLSATDAYFGWDFQLE